MKWNGWGWAGGQWRTTGGHCTMKSTWQFSTHKAQHTQRECLEGVWTQASKVQNFAMKEVRECPETSCFWFLIQKAINYGQKKEGKRPQQNGATWKLELPWISWLWCSQTRRIIRLESPFSKPLSIYTFNLNTISSMMNHENILGCHLVNVIIRVFVWLFIAFHENFFCFSMHFCLPKMFVNNLECAKCFILSFQSAHLHFRCVVAWEHCCSCLRGSTPSPTSPWTRSPAFHLQCELATKVPKRHWPPVSQMWPNWCCHWVHCRDTVRFRIRRPAIPSWPAALSMSWWARRRMRAWSNWSRAEYPRWDLRTFCAASPAEWGLRPDRRSSSTAPAAPASGISEAQLPIWPEVVAENYPQF